MRSYSFINVVPQNGGVSEVSQGIALKCLFLWGSFGRPDGIASVITCSLISKQGQREPKGGCGAIFSTCFPQRPTKRALLIGYIVSCSAASTQHQQRHNPAGFGRRRQAVSALAWLGSLYTYICALNGPLR